MLNTLYSLYSTVGLAQQWDQLDQLGMRMQHNLEQQIQARNQSGVSEDALKEFSMMFKVSVFIQVQVLPYNPSHAFCLEDGSGCDACHRKLITTDSPPDFKEFPKIGMLCIRGNHDKVECAEIFVPFQHFDKEKCGRLNHAEFKSCLRALGYDLPMIEEGQTDPEFEAILNVVDPNRDGVVSLQEYMAFMISKETENVHSSEEIQNAFQAIAAGDRPYVLRDELYQVSVVASCRDMIMNFHGS